MSGSGFGSTPRTAWRSTRYLRRAGGGRLSVIGRVASPPSRRNPVKGVLRSEFATARTRASGVADSTPDSLRACGRCRPAAS
jgi:hypothetical protein